MALTVVSDSIAFSSSSCIDGAFAWRWKPAYPVPSYSMTSAIRLVTVLLYTSSSNAIGAASPLRGMSFTIRV